MPLTSVHPELSSNYNTKVPEESRIRHGGNVRP